MAAKLEVQVRHCFCCGLTPGTALIGIYSLLLYTLLIILAIIALNDTAWHGDKTWYEGCQLEAQGLRDRRIQFHGGQTMVVVEDSSSFQCSIGMYTAEMKFAQEARYLALLIALCLYVPLVLASLALLVGVVVSSHWLLLPWLVLLPLDVLRGLISTVLIFVFSQGQLARIATGIFFLGLQLLHISLWILVLAKFQRLRHRHTAVYYQQSPAPLSQQQQYDPRQPFPPSTQQQPYGPGIVGGASQPQHLGNNNYGGGGGTYSPQSGRHTMMMGENNAGSREYHPGGGGGVGQQQPNYEANRY